jgi:hypothetical protein
MPFLAPVIGFIAANAATIGAIASVAGAGVSIGETLSNRPGQPQQQQVEPTAVGDLSTPGKEQATANASTAAQQKAAIARQYPNLQEQLGGAVAPDYLISQAATEAGAPGETNVGADAFRQFLGDRSLTDVKSMGATAPGPSGQDFWEKLQPQMPGTESQQGALSASGGNV